MKKQAQQDVPARESSLFRRHVHLGWLSILVYLSLGIVLEAMHGFKVDWYVNVANETRRRAETRELCARAAWHRGARRARGSSGS